MIEAWYCTVALISSRFETLWLCGWIKDETCAEMTGSEHVGVTCCFACLPLLLPPWVVWLHLSEITLCDILLGEISLAATEDEEENKRGEDRRCYYLIVWMHGEHCTFPAPTNQAHALPACADYSLSPAPDGSTHAENMTDSYTLLHLTPIYQSGFTVQIPPPQDMSSSGHFLQWLKITVWAKNLLCRIDWMKWIYSGFSVSIIAALQSVKTLCPWHTWHTKLRNAFIQPTTVCFVLFACKLKCIELAM